MPRQQDSSKAELIRKALKVFVKTEQQENPPVPSWVGADAVDNLIWPNTTKKFSLKILNEKHERIMKEWQEQSENLSRHKRFICSFNQNSSAHSRVYPYYAGLIVPTTVLTELDYMVATRLGVHIVRDFYRGIESGFVTHIALEDRDLTRAFEIMDIYQDAEVGLTDASIVALAELTNPPRSHARQATLQHVSS